MTEHRSRLGWPLMQERRAAPRTRRLALVILYVAVALNMVLTALVFSYVTVLKHARDTEQTRIEQRIERNNCALLDELPYERVLEPLRLRYHCGPGLPS